MEDSSDNQRMIDEHVANPLDGPAPFAPLTATEIAAAGKPSGQKNKLPFRSVPTATPPNENRFRHPVFGVPAQRYPYFNMMGQLLGYTLRDWTDRASKVTPKELRPLFHGTIGDKPNPGWHWRVPPAPRALFGLPSLVANLRAPVLVVEGEKAATAAAELTGMAVISCMNGAESPHLSDWRPLSGRDVIIWPDHDPAGLAFAQKVAELVREAGAVSVGVVDVDGLPEGWDLADELPDGWSVATVLERITGSDLAAERARLLTILRQRPAEPQAGASPRGVYGDGAAGADGDGAEADGDEAADGDSDSDGAEGDSGRAQPGPRGSAGNREPIEERNGFRVVRVWTGHGAKRVGPGLYREVEREDKQTGKVTTSWSWFGSLLEIEAATRDVGSESWGVLLAVHDPDGVVHHWSMPREMLAGDGVDYRKRLAHLGFRLKSGGGYRQWLGDYISMWTVRDRARCVDRIGWHGPMFVLPDSTIGDMAGSGAAIAGAELVVLQATATPPVFQVAGTLKDWQRRVAAVCRGNSRLMFAVSVALAGPLLHLIGEENGGFHLWGSSSIGKTVALRVATSIYGMDLGSWRTTDNGLEGLARNHNDLLLTLDEIGQCPAQVVSEIAYLLGNGTGKSRMRRDTSARPSTTWRLLFLSTGEVALAAKLGEDGRGKRPMAGQTVRVVEVPADAGAGLGLFERLHGEPDAAALAVAITSATKECCGTAGREFLELLTANLDRAANRVKLLRSAFIEAHRPEGADGQVLRVLGRFALVAAAGELAVDMEVLPWAPGEAEVAALVCFQAWLEARGGIEPAEVRDAVDQVRLFIELHGMSRFEPAWQNQTEAEQREFQAEHGTDGPAHRPDVRIINRVGFRRLDDDGAWTYYVTPEAWKKEVCKGMDPKLVAKVLLAKGYLEPGHGGKASRTVSIPGMGKPRVYVVLPSLMASEE